MTENIRYTIYTSRITKEKLEELSIKTKLKKGVLLAELVKKIEKCNIETLEDFINLQIKCKSNKKK